MNARPRPLRHAPLWLFACLLATAIAGDGRAQAPAGPTLLAPPPTDQARIGAAGRGLDGRAAINQAAGQANAQANQAALALAPGGVASAAAFVQQRAQAAPAAASARGAQARIDAGAFDRASGLLQLNQAAGAGNAQRNQFALAHGSLAHGGALADAELAAIAGPPAPPPNPRDAALPREATIAAGALRGGQGVLQLNQTAGTGNDSVNAFVLRLPGSAP